MARKKSPSSPTSSYYAVAEEAGQQVFHTIPALARTASGVRKRAAPLLHTRTAEFALTEGTGAEAQTESRSTIDPPRPNEPSLPFSAAELNIQHLTARQISCVVISWMIFAFIIAVVIFRADVSEIGTSAFKITGLGREVVLGLAGFAAVPFGALAASASLTISRAWVWRLSRYGPRRIIVLPITLVIVAALLAPVALSVLLTHKHMAYVGKSIYRSVLNKFTMPTDWTPIQPPPPLPQRKPIR